MTTPKNIPYNVRSKQQSQKHKTDPLTLCVEMLFAFTNQFTFDIAILKYLCNFISSRTHIRCKMIRCDKGFRLVSICRKKEYNKTLLLQS